VAPQRGPKDQRLRKLEDKAVDVGRGRGTVNGVEKGGGNREQGGLKERAWSKRIPRPRGAHPLSSFVTSGYKSETVATWIRRERENEAGEKEGGS